MEGGGYWRVVYCVLCPCEARRRREKQESQIIQTDIIMGLRSSSTMADAKFKKEVNKIIEIITVHRTKKTRTAISGMSLNRETSWELRFGSSEQ